MVFGTAIPDYAAYGPVDPIVEVLVDVGMIEDERQTAWERLLQDRIAVERYAVTIESIPPEEYP